NVEMQYDYRIVYGNIVKDWLLVDDTQLNTIFPGLMTNAGTSDGVKFTELPLAQQIITGADDFIGYRFSLEDCFPNPAKDKTTFRFRVNSTNEVHLSLHDNQGRNVKTIAAGTYQPGEHKIETDLTNLPPGNYIYQLKSGFFKDSKKLAIVK
ncbi:MAG: T9SS type A sorting domain-containing protein, partial [Bacteroidota bacterium]